MSRWSVFLGAALVALGIVSYAGSGTASPTALIPAIFGLLFVVLGLVARREERRALAMHLAVGLALVGFLGSVQGLVGLPDLLAGGDVERPWAVGAQSVMALLLAVFLVLAVRSFVAARRARAT